MLSPFARSFVRPLECLFRCNRSVINIILFIYDPFPKVENNLLNDVQKFVHTTGRTN